MARRVTKQPVQAERNGDPVPGAVSSVPMKSGPTAPLYDLAEELGRLLARRELARTDRRRGYSMVELVFGGALVALVWILVARAMGHLPR